MPRLILPSTFLLLSVLTSGFISLSCDADDEKSNLRFFETEIRPLLSKHCFSCHGPQKQESGLRVDSKKGIMAGGDSGGVIEAGHPEDSLLLEVLEREEDQMPPGKRLSEREISAVKKWIQLGAPWPENSVIKGPGFTEEDRKYWAFQPLQKTKPVRDQRDQWSFNEIDFFTWREFEKRSRTPELIAPKVTLLRRVYFDLLGLPPTLKEQQEFLADTRPDAYERLVDRLLNDPRYGEKWARHWLDLVRYAESDGYKQDDYRPNAWRYRDYVIQSFNDDKPYDRFILEQLAGDELDPDNPECRVATGFLRHWIYEYNQRDVRTQWDTILNDVTNVTGDVFLGLSMNCARCHDHKFDPILQKDYFRLKAVFASLYPRDDLPLASSDQIAAFQKAEKEWLRATAKVRQQIEEIETPYHQKKMNPEIEKFPLDIRPMMRKSQPDRSPFEHQLASMAYRQVKKLTPKEMETKLKGKTKETWKALREKLKEYDSIKPKPLPMALTVTDVGHRAPPTFLPGDSKKEELKPGVPSILNSNSLPLESPDDKSTTGRRLALARWMIQPENPLTTRVIVNRIWHYHFGVGIARTTSDFGRLGKRPLNNELLDFLAVNFVEGGWKFKRFHKFLMMSNTYRQAASTNIDPKLRCLQPAVRRLDAEQIRDAMLCVSGELDKKHEGPSVDSKGTSRTVFTKVIRNNRNPLLDVFDAPDNFNSTSARNVTTTPTQSLLMINGNWTQARAKAMADQFLDSSEGKQKIKNGKVKLAGGLTSCKELVERAYQVAFCRLPSQVEIDAALEFLDSQKESRDVNRDRLIDFCHILLNSNEFIYLD